MGLSNLKYDAPQLGMLIKETCASIARFQVAQQRSTDAILQSICGPRVTERKFIAAALTLLANAQDNRVDFEPVAALWPVEDDSNLLTVETLLIHEHALLNQFVEGLKDQELDSSARKVLCAAAGSIEKTIADLHAVHQILSAG